MYKKLIVMKIFSKIKYKDCNEELQIYMHIYMYICSQQVFQQPYIFFKLSTSSKWEFSFL